MTSPCIRLPDIYRHQLLEVGARCMALRGQNERHKAALRDLDDLCYFLRRRDYLMPDPETDRRIVRREEGEGLDH